jgi:hypothetical protein
MAEKSKPEVYGPAGMRRGDSVTIDPDTRKVTHINGEPVEHDPSWDAFVDAELAHLGQELAARNEPAV